MDTSDQYRLRDDNSPVMETNHKIDLFIERFDIVLSDFCPDICPCTDIAVALPVFTYWQN